MTKKLTQFLTILLILGLSLFYADYAYAGYTFSGCQDAWNNVSKASKINNLQDLVKTDCAFMYKRE